MNANRKMTIAVRSGKMELKSLGGEGLKGLGVES